jgi:hypothetical protein
MHSQISYPSAIALMEHLQHMGEGNATLSRRLHVGADTFLAVAALYQGKVFLLPTCGNSISLLDNLRVVLLCFSLSLTYFCVTLSAYAVFRAVRAGRRQRRSHL